MTLRTLGEFIQRLDREGQLVRVGMPASRDLEIT
jgi:3-polyprenyl-4-hydroxybenzoate decarboxylase